jgi:dephospho-CoA kinase
MEKRILRVGLTGGRFSGKSSVSKLFKQIHIPVFDADAFIKYLLNYDSHLVKRVNAKFGRFYTISNYLNPMAFDNDEKFDELIQMVEGRVFDAFDDFVDKYGSQYVIFQSSLIVERNWGSRFDYTINVFAPLETRIHRYVNSTGESLESTWKVFEKEISDREKNSKCDYVIHNYTDGPDILRTIENLDNNFVEEYFRLNRKIRMEEVNDNFIKINMI